ncbi:protein JTB [Sitodiplosis mosellana]|uniref:protein JTB n=1 Tax=Sitodiplosis mosellana TaxID=263140 RepID=UPI0024448BDD|nr:protein JTB [Sitodiplosis mosellana]
MIESCPKKRMVFAITLLTIATIIVLIVESHWTESSPRRKFVIENNSTCYLREEFEIIRDCHPCTDFEIASKSQGVCVHTHNKEVLRCKSGETVSRSCDKVAWVDERNFWTFEGILLVVSALSTSVTFLRQRSLDRKVMLKVQRQLEQSV